MTHSKLFGSSCALLSVLTIVAAAGCDDAGTAQSADPAFNQLPAPHDAGSELSALIGSDGAVTEHDDDAGGHDSRAQDASYAPPSSADAACAPTADAGPQADGTFGSVFALLKKDCASCHVAGKSPEVTTMDATYADLVGAPSKRSCAGSSVPPPVLVIPGDPDNSLLLLKLLGHQTCGKQMPITALLPADQVEVYRAWIAAGAPRD
jgi:hypothetical protein